MICHGKTHEDFVVMRKALTFWATCFRFHRYQRVLVHTFGGPRENDLSTVIWWAKNYEILAIKCSKCKSHGLVAWFGQDPSHRSLWGRNIWNLSHQGECWPFEIHWENQSSSEVETPARKNLSKYATIREGVFQMANLQVRRALSNLTHVRRWLRPIR